MGASPCAAMLPKPDVSTTDSLGASTSTIDKEEPAEEAALPDKKGHHPRLPPHLLGLLHMLKSPRALTGFSVTMLNSIVIGGLMDSGLTLWVKQEYGLNSSGAGLVFLGVVIPTFFVRSTLSHALLHREKTLTSLTVSRAGVPARRLGQSRSRSRAALVLCRSLARKCRSPTSTGPSGPWPLALPCRYRHTLSSSFAARFPCSSSFSRSSVSLTSRASASDKFLRGPARSALTDEPRRSVSGRRRALALHDARHGRPLDGGSRHARDLHRAHVRRVQRALLRRRSHRCISSPLSRPSTSLRSLSAPELHPPARMS